MSAQHRTGIVVATIGAGSSYAPMIAKELADRLDRLPVAELRLYDIDRARLRIVTEFARRLWGRDLRVVSPPSLPKALDGADFVLSQFRVGGLQARHQDIRLGLKYDLIGQETTGIGGFAKSLRTIPAILKVAAAMQKHCPRAWLINFTNPSSIITEAALTHGRVKCIGLCNGPYGARQAIADSLKVDPADVDLAYAGANHLNWVRGVKVKGRDVTATVRRSHLRDRAKNIPDSSCDPTFERIIGLPYSGYLGYYYYTPSIMKQLRRKKRSRAQEALAIERTLFKKYADPRTTSIPKELEKRGGAGYNIVAVNVIEALANDLGNKQIVNTANAGAIEGIKPDAVVEITCKISAAGARPIHFGPLEPQFRGLLQIVKAYEELAVQAGAAGDLEAALHALVLHPLGPSAENAVRVLRDLLKVNRQYLPQFSAAKVRKFFRHA